MKIDFKLIVVFSILIASCSLLDPYYLDLNETKRKNYHLVNASLLTDKNITNPELLYSINSKIFKDLIDKNKNFKLLIFFTNWCPNSSEFVPFLVSELIQFKNIDIFLISPDDWSKKYSYLSYMNKYPSLEAIYLLDIFIYGQKRSPHFRMDKFLSEICENCQDLQGFPSFLLFDEKNEIVFKKSGHIDSKIIIKYL